jgi:hypothetical protein
MLPMGENTHIFNRFKWWSVADCACEFCLYWESRKRICTLTACACEDVRTEAIRREQETAVGACEEAMPCLA